MVDYGLKDRVALTCLHDWSSRDENQLLLNVDANLAKIP